MLGLLSIGLVLLLASATSAGDLPFAVQTIPSEGRSVAAELADFDGDGRVDVLQGVVFGMPPAERRVLRVYRQRDDGRVPERHDIEVAVPKSAATYDIADVDGVAGDDVLLLQPRGVSILAFSRAGDGTLEARTTEARIPEDLTMAADSDERGLDRLAIASFDFGDEPRLIVPGIGETFVLSPTGDVIARIRGGVRANYFIQPPGPFLTESDIQAFVDSPRISVGDIDGDGRPDILASTRHELRLFFQHDDGGFSREADRKIALGRVSLEDHIRGSGSVRSAGRDIDGDGRLDLLLSLTRGSVMSASASSYVHLNHGTGWNLDRPDASFESAESLSADQLVDLDGDGRLELVRMGVKISVLELVEIFVQRALDASLNAYSLERRPAGTEAPSTAPEPIFTKKIAVKLDFETSRPAGFMPTILFDLNGDGFVDFLGSGDGSQIEVHLGSREAGFQRPISQEISTEGRIRGGDLDGDDLPDFILFNTRRTDEPLRLVRNLGRLPGTPPRATIESREP